MNKTKYSEIVTETELSDVVTKIPVYKTADFEFVAAALTLQEPPVRIIGKEPFDHPTLQRGELRRKFLFLLTCPVNQLTDNWEEKIMDLATRYVNMELLVEPTTLAAKRKFLRGYLLDNDSEKGKKRGK